jgi:tripartite-type tricarboxylate transporter receptor subunit TctC
MEIHRHELKYSLVLIDASAALKDLETRTLLEQQTMQIIGSSPENFASFIKQDIAIWKQVADQAKVEVR